MIYPTEFDIGRVVQHVPAQAQGDRSHRDCRWGRLVMLVPVRVLVRLGVDDQLTKPVELSSGELYWDEVGLMRPK